MKVTEMMPSGGGDAAPFEQLNENPTNFRRLIISCCQRCRDSLRHRPRSFVVVPDWRRLQNSWSLSFFVAALLFAVDQCDAKEDASAHLPHANTFLQITTVEAEPYVMVDHPSVMSSSAHQLLNRTSQTGIDDVMLAPRYHGYIPDLLRAVSALVDFRYELSVVADGSYGFKKTSTQWSGLIGELLNGNADVAAGPILVTDDRRQVVDFTVPFMTLQATLLLRRPTAGAESKVKDLADLVGQSEIKYGTLRRGVIPRSFRQTNDSLLSIVWRNMRRFGPDVLTSTNEEGIEKVRREKFAFILPDTIGEYVAQRSPCDLISVGRFLDRRSYAFALPKHSRYLADFNGALKKLRKEGYLDRLKAQWWTDRSQCSNAVHGARTSRMYGKDRYITSSSASTIFLTVSARTATFPKINVILLMSMFVVGS